MGIAGLLPALRSVTQQRHLRQYSGERIAVDAYVWLHRGAYACSAALCKGLHDPAYIRFVERRLQMLLDAGIEPVLVFDGGPLPAKVAQETQRAKQRHEYLAAALECEANGDNAAAFAMFKKAVDVSPEMAKRAMDAVKLRFGDRVKCLVAPYEADAQLTWLSNHNYVDAVLTEDSDLLAYGCRRVLFKLDNDGFMEEVQLDRLGAAVELDLQRWTLPQFRLMCVLSGCDYSASIPGLGLKTAHRLVQQYRTRDGVLRALRLQGRFTVPPGYAEAVRRAELTFEHQRVFDWQRRIVVPLHELSEDFLQENGSDDFLGPPMDPELGIAIAEGEVDPISCAKFDIDARKDEADAAAAGKAEKQQAMVVQKIRRRKSLLSPPPKTKPISSYFKRSSEAVKRPFVLPRRVEGDSKATSARSPKREERSSRASREVDEEDLEEKPTGSVHRAFQSQFVRSGRISAKCSAKPKSRVSLNFDSFRFQEKDREATAAAEGAGRRHQTLRRRHSDPPRPCKRPNTSEAPAKAMCQRPETKEPPPPPPTTPSAEDAAAARTTLVPLSVPLPVPAQDVDSANRISADAAASATATATATQEDSVAATPSTAPSNRVHVPRSVSITSVLCNQTSQLRALDFYKYSYSKEVSRIEQVLQTYDDA